MSITEFSRCFKIVSRETTFESSTSAPARLEDDGSMCKLLKAVGYIHSSIV